MAQSNKWQDVTLAAAGILQATALVDQLARTGFIPSDAYSCSINSLFQTNPTDTLSVYGELADMRLGLETLRDLLRSSRQLQNDTVRYSAGILHLQGRLRKRKDMLQVISSRIGTATSQAQHFGPTHDNVVANLADIYSDTLSRFRFRIQVAGDPSYLQQQRVANQVRALLLAAIRSAMLWRQVGGSRLQILLHRKKLLAETERLLQQIPL
ncbi:high frequency lysogenization protein HflD [Gilvimarinus sp. SDUM040013]|uniref:High frequency lysogenization protein HflD homolog n=1 Tax=Gilvimarinus gilvus TaxID=3058038 RepID=A0ABU4S4L8_9GAMM|nr:high frequency lysogenization protein HflD [Gilvimarinus sp. SDUM040013]MDO3388759.1 high frequency lysogenization protein HflD [Gilvimarinus sp. SDUM040013]MDX6851366.1 high frequency lysogenization protein HflD [Gilvimarinus sp. SDUM040013]